MTTAALEQHYDSMGALIAHVKSDITTRFGEEPGTYGQCRALEPKNWKGVTLASFLREIEKGSTRIQTLHDSIEATAASVTAGVPALPVYARQRVHGTFGSTVNIHKVLRGDHKPWTRMQRLQRLDEAAHIVIVVPLAFSHDVKGEQLSLAVGTTLALARACTLQGRTVEVIGINYSEGTYCQGGGRYQERSHVVTIDLLQSWEPWEGQRLATIACPEFLRRVIFREMELNQCADWQVSGGYGRIPDRQALLAYLDTWRATHGYSHATVVLGCTQFDRVHTEHDARQWIERTLTTLGTEDDN